MLEKWAKKRDKICNIDYDSLKILRKLYNIKTISDNQTIQKKVWQKFRKRQSSKKNTYFRNEGKARSM